MTKEDQRHVEELIKHHIYSPLLSRSPQLRDEMWRLIYVLRKDLAIRRWENKARVALFALGLVLGLMVGRAF
jgi:hypothetical protein